MACDELMTRNTSVVAFCCSTASFSSRLSRATSVSWPARDGLQPRNLFGERRCFCETIVRRGVLAGLPPAPPSHWLAVGFGRRT